MPDLIYHHYANSPFAEKGRLLLGHKNLTWQSVNIPPIMPKPDVVALTGGYRRTPFLQIGADIYCDTALIADVLERLAPTPTLYPPAQEGAARILAQWADTTLFWTIIPYCFQPAGLAAIFAGMPPEMAKAFADDRAAMRANAPRMHPAEAEGQLREQLRWLEGQVADGRSWMLGEAVSIADFSVYHCLWFVRRIEALAPIFASTPKLLAWMDRVAAIGHSSSTRLKSTEAIEIALAAQPAAVDSAFVDYHGIKAGERVTITPSDYAQDAVEGELVIATATELAVRREDERAGEVVVHFPRMGYRLKKL